MDENRKFAVFIDYDNIEIGVKSTLGRELDMGSAWDTFSKASHYAAAKGEAMANRKRLRKAMSAQGFEPYELEWWHFTLPSDPSPPVRDEAYGP